SRIVRAAGSLVRAGAGAPEDDDAAVTPGGGSLHRAQFPAQAGRTAQAEEVIGPTPHKEDRTCEAGPTAGAAGVLRRAGALAARIASRGLLTTDARRVPRPERPLGRERQSYRASLALAVGSPRRTKELARCRPCCKLSVLSRTPPTGPL